jgi:transposase
VPSKFALSDTLWARVAAILATVDPTPPHNARAILEAIIYRALTGTIWQDLPAVYPSPAVVMDCAARWEQLGLWPRLEPVLLVRLDA